MKREFQTYQKITAAHEAAYGSDAKAPGAVAGSGCCGMTGANELSPEECEQLNAKRRAYDLQQIGASIHVMGPSFGVAITSMQEQVFAAMRVNGFWDGPQDNFAAKTALVHSELSEMLEANRKPGYDDKVCEFTGEEAEAADVIIRLLDMAGRYNWRLGDAVVAKMKYNLSRPYKHGKLY